MTNESRTTVTVLGLGSMGRALAGAFLDAGHAVTVWNRTPGRDGELVARGASRTVGLSEAIRASDLVVACLLDQAASRDVLGPVTDDLRGRTLVDLSSDTPQRARDAAAWAEAEGLSYLDGTILVNVPLVGSPGAQVLYSGPSAAYERHEATLRALGGGTVHLGEDHALAAAYDVATLDYFWTAMSGMVHAFALARADGIAAADLLPFLVDINALLGSTIAPMADAMDAGSHPGVEDSLVMDTASATHVLRAAEGHGLDVSVLCGVVAVAERAIAMGHGAESWSASVRAVRPT